MTAYELKKFNDNLLKTIVNQRLRQERRRKKGVPISTNKNITVSND